MSLRVPPKAGKCACNLPQESETASFHSQRQLPKSGLGGVRLGMDNERHHHDGDMGSYFFTESLRLKISRPSAQGIHSLLPFFLRKRSTLVGSPQRSQIPDCMILALEGTFGAGGTVVLTRLGIDKPFTVAENIELNIRGT